MSESNKYFDSEKREGGPVKTGITVTEKHMV